MALIKKANTGEDVRKEELIFTVGESKPGQPLRKLVWRVLKKARNISTI